MENNNNDSFYQLISVMYCLLTLFVIPPLSIFAMIYTLLFSDYYWIVLIYLLWVFYDRDTRLKGNKSWLRNSKLCHHTSNYFHAKLVKTAELDPTRNYIFCAYPHGIICSGAFCSMATDAIGVKKLFPKIKTHLTLLDILFWLPLAREFFISLGCVSVSEKSFDYLLSVPEGGHALVVLLGGAAEAQHARPNVYRFMIKNRKGFARLALKHGAPLVPVISFGENDLYTLIDIPTGSPMQKLRDFLHKKFGVFYVLPWGRFFIIPLRKPVTTVVGRPIEVEKISEPTNEQIEHLKERFIEGITELFEKEKYKYVEDPKNKLLEII